MHADAMRSLREVQTKSSFEKHQIAMQSARARKSEQVSSLHSTSETLLTKYLLKMAEVYRIMSITLGTPPKPDSEFTWEYYDKDKKFHSVTSTPLKFYHEHAAGINVSQAISLIHDPRNKEGLYTVDRLGNVVGGRPVLYVNTKTEQLKQVAIGLLKNDTPVWFGCDVGKSSSSSLGIMNTKLFDMQECFGTDYGMNKAQRLRTGDSEMTHAMVSLPSIDHRAVLTVFY